MVMWLHPLHKAKAAFKVLGGTGSGNFGHAGRQGERGGSADKQGGPAPKRTLQAQVKHYGGTIKKGADFQMYGEWDVSIGGKDYQFSALYNPEAARWHYKEKGTEDWKPAGDYPEEFIPKLVEQKATPPAKAKEKSIEIPPPVISREQGRQILADMIKGAEPIGGNFYVAGIRDGKSISNVTLEISYFDNSIHLAFIGVQEADRGKGVGSKMLAHLTRKADEHGVPMDLDVDPQGTGGLNKAQLFKWYKKFGFVRQPYMAGGGMSEHMIRQPKSPKTNSFHSLT